MQAIKTDIKVILLSLDSILKYLKPIGDTH